MIRKYIADVLSRAVTLGVPRQYIHDNYSCIIAVVSDDYGNADIAAEQSPAYRDHIMGAYAHICALAICDMVGGDVAKRARLDPVEIEDEIATMYACGKPQAEIDELVLLLNYITEGGIVNGY